MTLDDKVKAFLTVSSGDGSGYGYGYGSGSGDGYGSGSGSGDGSGYGDGSGSGSGSGYGSGYGDGSGSGSGSGYGSGIKRFNGETVYRIDGVNTLIRSVRGNTAHGAIVNNDLTLTPCYIVKQDDVFAHGATLREAMEALRDKLFEDMPENERIDAFLRETDREKAYPTQYFYDWHHRLTGSCDMGRKQFARDHGVDLEHGMMTLAEFLKLTKDAYGGDVIRKVMSRMQEVER
nr:MAG TPA: colicin E3 [Caudoviricetes sp.]